MRTRTFAALILALACQRTSATSQVDKTFLLGFLAGEYRLVGQAPDSGAAYVGQVTLRQHKGSLEIVRTVAGVSTRGSGTIEAAGEGGTLVLKARFSVSAVAYEATYLWKSDLDNYPRLTGYTYRAAGETKSPGLEALFHIPPTPKK